MKKLCLFLILVCIYQTAYARTGNLYYKFKDYPEIKVYLDKVGDESDNPKVVRETFRKVFKEVIEKRIEIKFVYVDNKKNADVIVKAKIESHIFTKNALPAVTGVFALAADATAPKSEGMFVVDYEIYAPGNDKQLLFYDNFTTSARRPRKDMEGEMGYRNAVRKNVNRFVYTAFYEQKQR